MLLKVKSFIWGYYAYMDDWEPNAEDAFSLKREPNNMNESNAVALVQAAKKENGYARASSKTAEDGRQANNAPEQLDRPI